MIIVTREIIIAKLDAYCEKRASYGAAAKALGITPAQLSTARNNPKRPLPARLLSRLGYVRTHVYAEKPSKKKANKKATPETAQKTDASTYAQHVGRVNRSTKSVQLVRGAVAVHRALISSPKVLIRSKDTKPPFGHGSTTEPAEERQSESTATPTTVVDFSDN